MKWINEGLLCVRHFAQNQNQIEIWSFDFKFRFEIVLKIKSIIYNSLFLYNWLTIVWLTNKDLPKRLSWIPIKACYMVLFAILVGWFLSPNSWVPECCAHTLGVRFCVGLVWVCQLVRCLEGQQRHFFVFIINSAKICTFRRIESVQMDAVLAEFPCSPTTKR